MVFDLLYTNASDKLCSIELIFPTMDLKNEQHSRTASLSSNSASPRNLSKPASVQLAPSIHNKETMSKEVQTTAVNTTFAPETPIVAETRRGWKPLGFLSVLRNVPVQTPCWLFVIRSVQTLLAGVVIAYSLLVLRSQPCEFAMIHVASAVV